MGRSAALVHSRKSPLSRIEQFASSCHPNEEEQGERSGMTLHRYKNAEVGNIDLTKKAKKGATHTFIRPSSRGSFLHFPFVSKNL
jgi:hypothetical protein